MHSRRTIRPTRRALFVLLPVIALVLLISGTSAFAGRLGDLVPTSAVQSSATTAGNSNDATQGFGPARQFVATYRAPFAPTQREAPLVADAFLTLAPSTTAGNCPAPTNGGTTQVGCRFVLDLILNTGTNTDATAQQSYLTFTKDIIQNVRVDQIGSTCTLTNTLTPDPTVFDASLQNEVCNGTGAGNNSPCVFRGVNVAPGSIGFASGALNNCPDGCGGVFRVGQIGLCATSPGTATLHWQFSPPAPPTRDTEIVSLSGDLIHNPALFTDYTFTVTGGGGGTPTVTSTVGGSTATVTSTVVPPTGTSTSTSTAVPPTVTATRTSTSVPATNTSTSTATGVPATNTSTRTSTTVPATNTNTSTSTTVPATNTATSTATGVPATNTSTRTSTTVPATNTNTSTSTVVPATNTSTSTATGVPATNTTTRTSTTVPATNTSTATNTNTATTVPATNTSTRTSTTVPATNTTTSTSVPATNTTTRTSTSTSVPATNTSTSTTTSVPATNTRTSTSTSVPSTSTATRTSTIVPITRTTTATATSTPANCNCRQDVVLTQYLTVVGDRVQATYRNTSTTCSHLVGIATYQRVNNNIDDQILFDYEQVVLAPGETRTLSAALPDCSYQADAFCGEVIRSFQGGVRYGDRLFDDIVHHGRFCEPGSGTTTPVASRTATPATTRTATRTATPEECSTCNVYISNVDVNCNTDGTIHWSAELTNNADCTVSAPWKAELQIRTGNNGRYRTLATQRGTGSYTPGTSMVSGNVCTTLRPNVTSIRVVFTVTGNEEKCNPTGTSSAIEPCEHSGSCSDLSGDSNS